MASLGLKTGMVVCARFLTRATQIVSFVLLARALSVEAFGNYGILTSSVFLAALLGNLGLRQAAARTLGSSDIEADELCSAMLLLWPILSASCCLALRLVSPQQFAQISDYEAVCVYVSVFAIMALTLVQGIFLGQGKTNLFAYFDSGPRILQSAVIIMLWLLDCLSIYSAMMSFAVGFVVFIPFALSRVYNRGFAIRPRISSLPALIKYGFLFSASLFLVMLQGRVGLFFLSGSEGAVEAGKFFASQRASEIFLDIATGAALVLFSEASRTTAPQEMVEQSARVAAGIFLTFLVLAIIGMTLAPLAIQIVLGPAYADAKSTFMIMCAGLAPMAATRIMNSVVSGLGRPWISALVAMSGLALNAGACSILIPRWGADGAAIALVIGQTTCCVTYFIVCNRLFGMRLASIAPDFHAIGARISQLQRRFAKLR